MTDEQSSPGVTRKAGLRGLLRESHRPDLLSTLFAGAPSDPPPNGDVTNGITNCGMDDNDKWGCCGLAMCDHYNVAKSGDVSLIGKFGSPKFASLLDAYWAYGIAQGEPGPEPDQGVDNATLFQWAFDQGLIDAFMEIDKAHLRMSMLNYKGVCIGVRLDSAAESDFEAVPPIDWGAPGEVLDPNAGHDILVVKYDDTGRIMVWTWGGDQWCDADFVENNVSDCWVFVDEDDAKYNGVNYEALIAACKAGGTARDVTPPSINVIPTHLINAIEAEIDKNVEEIIHDGKELVDHIANDISGVFGRSAGDVSQGPVPRV